ncbi:MAG: transposase domain-containing protein [Lachnospiraceae bacterium]|nr:transposase domain-containing protein [Eubacterium sp.]MBR6258437.1 transposase domain-containing protein [Lachnospiraceae bacterium]
MTPSIYSLIDSIRKNEANPQIYLKNLLENVPEYFDLPATSSKLEELMPWSSSYKKYEDDEMIKAMEMMQIIKQEKPPYRPKKKTAA